MITDKEALERVVEELGTLQEIIRTVLEGPLFKEAPAPEPVKAPVPEPVKTYTLEEVRGKLAKLAASGKRSEAKAILTNVGYSRLSEVPEALYPKIIEEVEKFG